MNVSSEGSDDRAATATATATTTALPAAGSSDSYSDGAATGQRWQRGDNSCSTDIFGSKTKILCVLLFCCASVSFMLFSTFAFANTFVSVVCQSIFYAPHTPSSPLSSLSPFAFVALSAAFRQIKIASGRGKQKCFPFV